jgi:uncharacterized membrane protein YbaN (DUF454 family)
MSTRWEKLRQYRPLRVGLGALCLLLGVVGLVMPFFSGVIFLLAAGLLFGNDSVVGRWLNRLVHRRRLHH